MQYAYIYVLRVQITALLLLAFLAPLSLWPASPLSPLLGGVFDVGPVSIAVITLLTALAGAAIVACAEMVYRYGEARFRLDPLPDAVTEVVATFLGIEIRRITLITIVVCSLSAFVLLGGLIVAGREAVWARVVAVIVGIVASSAAIVVTLIWWTNMDRAVVRFIGVLLLWTPDGYLEVPGASQKPDTRQMLLPGHALLAAAAAATLVVYASFGISKGLDIRCLDAPVDAKPFYCVATASTSEPAIGPLALPAIPTLGSIVVALSLLVYTLSALTFLIDRFRMPLFVPILAMAVISADWPQADHYFDVSRAEQLAVTPSSVLTRGSSDRVVVVAASGGGIFAAAWTAAVLSRLEDEHGDDWHEAVRLVSAVSGGSVGTMYFLDAIDRGALHKDSGRREVFDRASTSSLDDIAWALVYPDFWRLITPMFVSTDRGYAAEHAWARLAPRVKAPLSTWRRRVADGTLPAVAFNATVVDSGGRIVMATTDFASRDLSAPRERPARSLTFGDWFGDEYEPSIVGAVRLSASFTYVSPAARIDTSSLGTPMLATRAYHVVDGGYYDNFGVSSLVDWLRAALRTGSGSVTHVLVLQIRGPMALQDPDAKPGRGLIPQIAAPLSTLAHFRSAAQIAHNSGELQLLCEVAREKKVVLENAVFQYPDGNVPLSWHLTEAQQQDVWNAARTAVAEPVAHVGRFMRRSFDDSGTNCARF